MRERIASDVGFEHSEMSKADALERFAGQPFKIELIEGIADDHVSLYRQGEFLDLCEGPHVEHAAQVPPFKLTSVAGAYWRGDEKRPMLQRIYGAMFETQEELDDYLARIEEAARRDHRKLGRELELFTSSDLVGAGLPTLLPKGATIRRLLEEYILKQEREAGYQHVYSPVLGKVDLYKTSGHWEHYRDGMFPPMKLEHEEMVLRPMNCPHHILVYQTQLHSYRELPLRIAEIGTMYRYEKSGVVGGLSRVRAMALNDAHIFCRPDQIKPEIAGVMRLVERAYATLGIKDYVYRLSLRDPADTEKYVQDDELWSVAERELREAMDELGLPVLRGRRRGGVLRAEDRHPDPRHDGPRGDDVDGAGGPPPAEQVRPGVHRRGRREAPARDDPSRHHRHDGAHDGVPDRAVRGRVPRRGSRPCRPS